MEEHRSELAQRLRAALEASEQSIEDLADRTKVPRTTILALIEEPIAAVLPERVYLRGHLKVIVQALRLDQDALLQAFDDAYPISKPASESSPISPLPARSLAVSAGLYGIALVAVAVALFTAMS